MPKAERDLRRLAYCGTCKSLGTLFGQKSRFLLNHDPVFLAELLLALAAGPERASLDRAVSPSASAFRSYHCLALPQVDEIPLELKIAASVNVVLAEFKLHDKLVDAPGLQWRIADKVFSGCFSGAARELEKLDFPMPEAFEWLARQVQRESAAESSPSGQMLPLDLSLLSSLAEPTEMITALFFSRAGIVCGCADETAVLLYELGCQFGRLVYVLDALEDFEQDRRKREFNAVRTCAGLSLEVAVLPDSARSAAVAELAGCLERIVDCLNSLPLPDSLRENFVGRFRSNTKARIVKLSKLRGQIAVSCNGKRRCQPSVDSAGLSARFSASQQFVARLGELPGNASSFRRITDLLARWYCFVLFFLFPRPTEAAQSSQDCLELPFNFIFLSGALASFGGLFRAGLAPFTLLAAGGPGSPGAPLPGPIPGPVNPERLEEHRRRGERCCNECDCCDACDGCGDCGDCCNCNCGDSGCGDCHCGHCDCCSGCDCSSCDCGSCDCSCNS